MSTPSETSAPSLDIVILGALGDLSLRKLMPSLYMAHLHESLSPSTRIIGVSRQLLQTTEFINFIDQKSRAFIPELNFQEASWQSFLHRLSYLSMDLSQEPAYSPLKGMCQNTQECVIYLATAPHLFAQICSHLASVGLNHAGTKIVLEKPLGHNLLSAQFINDQVAKYYQEAQIYRIDHYLGKETVQNLMVLRFANAIFEPLWRAPYIRSVQITVAESLGVGSRAGFYNSTGALRDMVQNHLLQLLCMVAMEAPISLDPDDIRDEKVRVLRSLRKMSLYDVKRDTVRGQYTAGITNGQLANGYLEEAQVPADSQTETFVALRTFIDNARWANVPFFLRTGKCLQKRQSEIVVEFSSLPFSIFPQSQQINTNRLVFGLQPQEYIHLEMVTKDPGTGMHLHPVKLSLDLLSTSTKRRAEAYERLLIDVIKGRLTHFMRRDELEQAWAWVDPILAGWQALNDRPRLYPAGTWGPPASSALMAREGLTWYEES
ncbi:MAG: glucose-6-phosphate dehydrogenase [Gammaproteobacteria bacterium]|nr:glucose-6-phosphate dehydrogenase [Gammaproteobacteria bacterium]